MKQINNATSSFSFLDGCFTSGNIFLTVEILSLLFLCVFNKILSNFFLSFQGLTVEQSLEKNDFLFLYVKILMGFLGFQRSIESC